LIAKTFQRESHSLIVGQTVVMVITTSDGFDHNYCMLGTIIFTLYFAAVAYVFYYMIRKDFFDND
jgi:hypothetical protein